MNAMAFSLLVPLGIAIGSLIVALLLAVLTVLRWRVPAVAWLLGPIAVLLAGAAMSGTGVGIVSGNSAFAMTTATTQAVVGYLFIGLVLLLACGSLLATGLLAAAGHAIRGDGPPVRTWRVALGALLSIWAGGTLSLLLGLGQGISSWWPLAVAGGAGGLVLAAGAVRWTREEGEVARLAASRFLVATCVMTGLACAVVGMHAIGRSLWLRSLLWGLPVPGGGGGLPPEPSDFSGAPLLVGALVGGLFAVAPAIGQSDLRGRMGAALAAVVLAAPVVALLWLGSVLDAFVEVTFGGSVVQSAADRVEVARGEARDWPPRGDCLVEPGTHGWRISQRFAGVGDCPAAPATATLPLEEGTDVLVVTPAGASALTLAQTRWFDLSGTLRLLVRGEDGVLRSRDVVWAVTPPAVDWPEDVAVLVPRSDWTVQDLVDRCAGSLLCAIAPPEPPERPAAAHRAAPGSEVTPVSAGPGFLGERGEGRLDLSGDRFRTAGDALDAEAISAVVDAQEDRLHYCYQKALPTRPELAGRVTVAFTVALDGTVSQARIEESTLWDAEVEECLRRRFLAMTFPEPPDGPVTSRYPFVFSPR